MEEEEDDFFAASNSPVAFGAMLKRSARDRELHEQLCAEVGSEDDEEESIPVKRIKTDASKEILKASDKKPLVIHTECTVLQLTDHHLQIHHMIHHQI